MSTLLNSRSTLVTGRTPMSPVTSTGPYPNLRDQTTEIPPIQRPFVRDPPTSRDTTTVTRPRQDLNGDAVTSRNPRRKKNHVHVLHLLTDRLSVSGSSGIHLALFTCMFWRSFERSESGLRHRLWLDSASDHSRGGHYATGSLFLGLSGHGVVHPRSRVGLPMGVRDRRPQVCGRHTHKRITLHEKGFTEIQGVE